MSHNRSGQTLLEYIMIGLLVCTAILIGGPVLKRSLFGAFRIQEDSVIDSFSEQMQQAASPIIPTPDCDCSIYRAGACGGGGCAATEKVFTRTCTPMDCAIQKECVSQIGCCTPDTGVQSIGCGTLVSGNATTNPNVDIPNPVIRGTYNLSSFTTARRTDAGITGLDQTVYLNGVDTHDCLINERLVSLTCGINGGGSAEVLACEQFNDPLIPSPCRPGCWGAIAANSTGCNGSEYGRDNNNLRNEVSYRKKGGVITGSTLTLDNPPRPIMAATLRGPLLPQPPYQDIADPNDPSWLSDVDATIYNGAWLMPWTYFSKPSATATTSPECGATRKCERMCKYGDLPSDDRTFCVTPKCDWISDQDKALANDVGGRMTYISPKMDVAENFLATVESYNLNYIVGCFDDNGLIIAGGANSSQIHTYASGGCTSGPFTISDRQYCFADGSASNPSALVPSTATAICHNARQVVVRIYNPSPITNPSDLRFSSDFMSYQVDYQQHNTGAQINVLTDDYVDIYASTQTWTQGKLLYSTPRLEPPDASTRRPWLFPAEFFAEGSGSGNIYLIAQHVNRAASGTDGNANPGGLSLQKKGNASGAGCFQEDVTIYNTHGARPLPSPTTPAPASSWLNNGCWIYSALNTGLDTQGIQNTHTLRLRAAVPGNAPHCDCTPACAANRYCIKGACVRYSPSLCSPNVVFLSSFENPVIGASQIMTSGFERWQSITGPNPSPGIELENNNPSLTLPAPYASTPIPGANGNQYIQMASVTNGPGNTITSAPFTTEVGQQYQLSFYLAPRSNAVSCGANDSQVRATYPGGSANFAGTTGGQCDLKSANFTAAAVSSTVSFTDVDITIPPIYVYVGPVYSTNICYSGQYSVVLQYTVTNPLPTPPTPPSSTVSYTITHATGTSSGSFTVTGVTNGVYVANLGTYTFTSASGASVSTSKTGPASYVTLNNVSFTIIDPHPVPDPKTIGGLVDGVTVRKVCP